MAKKSAVNFRLRITRGDDIALGPGKVDLLAAIAKTGSITSAAKTLGMSYRRAWLLVDETNRCLVRPAVETTTGGPRGGGASLTPAGVELVRRYRALERVAGTAVTRELNSLLRTIPAGRPSRK
jgi:molybdate transport system regulatory protein